ncbi:MAG: hypothetical protein H7Y03_05350 [Chitinophagaceae bacterium]|nr:hypothetical protein [Chitinophagaceae bacterium]
MKIIKLGLISFVVFSIMLLCFSAIIPSEIRISRAENMRASPKDLEQMLQTMKTKDSFPYNWQIYPFDTITTVQLYYDFRIKWYRPWEKLGSITYDKQLGPVMEKELAALKARAEAD